MDPGVGKDTHKKVNYPFKGFSMAPPLLGLHWFQWESEREVRLRSILSVCIVTVVNIGLKTHLFLNILTPKVWDFRRTRQKKLNFVPDTSPSPDRTRVSSVKPTFSERKYKQLAFLCNNFYQDISETHSQLSKSQRPGEAGWEATPTLGGLNFSQH